MKSFTFMHANDAEFRSFQNNSENVSIYKDTNGKFHRLNFLERKLFSISVPDDKKKFFAIFTPNDK